MKKKIVEAVECLSHSHSSECTLIVAAGHAVDMFTYTGGEPCCVPMLPLDDGLNRLLELDSCRELVDECEVHPPDDNDEDDEDDTEESKEDEVDESGLLLLELPVLEEEEEEDELLLEEDEDELELLDSCVTFTKPGTSIQVPVPLIPASHCVPR